MLTELALTKPPIAIAFLAQAPAGIPKWSGPAAPAGCSFWREAMNGKAFYTEPSDHYNCAVGSYTHAITLPPERGSQLEDTIRFMVGNSYIEMAEVPGIPTLEQSPAYVAYAPAESAPFQPDVVLVAARPGGAMLLYEAALRAGAGNALTNILGRPGCAVVPLTRKSGAAALSFGCKGNRTFTGLPDDELYVAIPGNRWDAVCDKFAEIARANLAMAEYYRSQQARFPLPVLG